MITAIDNRGIMAQCWGNSLCRGNAYGDYHHNGNIQQKSDAGIYDYSAPFPAHAVDKIYSPSAELLNSGNQEVEYTAFHKASTIYNSSSERLVIDYGVDQQRMRSRFYTGHVFLQKTKYFAANYEKEVTPSKTREINYISIPYGVLAAYIKENNSAGQMYYLYKDHLGSITNITNSAGTVVESRSFDAWGRLRNPVNWSYTNITPMTLIDRGYTGHEHLFGFDLINMNGRMYDPIIGRMLSPDPYVQGIAGTQGFNRYSYCLNNPLKFSDPTGEHPIIIGIIIGMMVNMAINANQIQSIGQAGCYAMVGLASGALGGMFGVGVGVAQGAILGAAGGFSAGFVAGAGNAWIAGANIQSGLNAGLKGGLLGAAFGVALGGISGGIRANEIGLDPWTGTGVSEFVVGSASETDLAQARQNVNKYNNSPSAEVDSYYLKGRMKSTFNVSEGDFGLNKISTKALPGYGMTETGVYVNLEKGTEVGACFSPKGLFGKPSLHVSPYYTHAGDITFRAVAGHELIHAMHSFLLGPAYQKIYSERVAYSYTSEVYMNAGQYINAAANNSTMLSNLYYGAYPSAYNINVNIPYRFLFIR